MIASNSVCNAGPLRKIQRELCRRFWIVVVSPTGDSLCCRA